MTVLKDRGMTFTPSGKDYLIKCLNPDHIDTNPSLRIDKLSGIGHCFACGYRVNIFKHFGIISDHQSAKVSGLKEKIAKIFAETRGLDMPKGWAPYLRSFRGISPKTLQTFEAFTVENHDELEDRIVFPIKDVTGKIICFIGRHVLADIKPRYRIYPHGIVLPLFPTKLYPVNGTLILVEGIFDALNLMDKGIPNVAATLGTQTFLSRKGINKEKVALLKLQGITKIIILFDGDTAGIKAAEELKPALEKENFFVQVIDLPEDRDPGDLSQDEVNHLRKLI